MRYEDYYCRAAREDVVIKRLLSTASKIGDEALCFNLPLDTCVGASPVCRARCYIHKSGGQNRHEVQDKAARNYAVAQSERFPGLMIGAILRTGVRWLRVHSCGDYFSVPYVWQWIKIARALPAVRFWSYTRSWALPEFIPALTTLASLPNFTQLLSCDRSMPIPPQIPQAPLCWLADSDCDEPPCKCLVVFRATAVKTLCGTLNGQTVCLYENGTKKPITCVECTICTAKK